MNSKDFQHLLEHPRVLYDLPQASLQQLAMDYPYSPNLRLLLLLKAHLEGHPDEADYLNLCAAAAFDRAFIYDLLQDTKRYTPPGKEDTEVLELRTLEDIALAEAALPADPVPAPAAALKRSLSYDEETVSATGSEETEIEETDALIGESAHSTGSSPDAPPSAIAFSTWVQLATSYHEVLPRKHSVTAGQIPADVTQRPEPVSRFTGNKRLESRFSLREQLQNIRRRQAGKMAAEQEEVRKIARRSLVAQEAVASETLAALLVRQGQYKNAIKMYKRLELLYPEKKTIFAGLIKELKEKL